MLFDVVLVFAFTRITGRLIEHLTWSSFYSAMVLALALTAARNLRAWNAGAAAASRTSCSPLHELAVHRRSC
ncbi:hypothetical protein [Micromonospora sp. NPDC093277]|uniref:hypothetical protein n=1 Tax=Micromonospora sp. NPDC093277 TaxID=3364291 RepID=UPI0037FC85CE